MSTTNRMVAHNWAHGVAGKGSNFSTDGQRLTSYATTVGWNTGRGLVFMSADSMSLSTGRQLHYARLACSHLDVISSPIFSYGRRIHDFDEKQAFRMACDAVSSVIEGYSKAPLSKYLASNIQRAYELVTELNGYAVKYGFDVMAPMQIADSKRAAAAAYAAEFEARDAKRRETARIAEHNRMAAQREKDFKQFDLWRAGQGVHCPLSFRLDADGGYYIAVHGDKVVTSGGAECPVEHARAAIKFWQARELDRGVSMSGAEYIEFTPWHRNGHRVQLGVFQLDRIEADGTAFAGCHKFSATELQRLADLLM